MGLFFVVDIIVHSEIEVFLVVLKVGMFELNVTKFEIKFLDDWHLLFEKLVSLVGDACVEIWDLIKIDVGIVNISVLRDICLALTAYNDPAPVSALDWFERLDHDTWRFVRLWAHRRMVNNLNLLFLITSLLLFWRLFLCLVHLIKFN